MRLYQPFRFKQFSIAHNNSAMKVGTDAVLLGAWAKMESPKSILDIGAGTGIISLMLAQRYPDAKITAIEISSSASEDARENFQQSPFNERLTLIEGDFLTQNFESEFDMIVSNPPYFSEDYLPEKVDRTKARHDQDLSLSDLFFQTKNILSPKGQVHIVLPFDREKEAIEIALNNNLKLLRRLRVKGTVNSPFKRSLLAYSKRNVEIQEEELVIELERHKYTPDYIRLTKDFYLKM